MASKSKLYPTKATPLSKTATGASNLTFATSLTSLLATSASNNESRSRPSRSSHSNSANNRDSIFTSHNKGLNKRALADEASTERGGSAQKHSKTSEGIDAATLHRSKRKMEEKARLYASMKRGDYVPSSNSHDREADGLIDFDRKWAEKEEEGGIKGNDDTSSDDYNDDDDDDPIEQVEYEDEFGRMRTGTKSDAAREQRRRNAQAYATTSLADSSARPQIQHPENLIRGDTVQAAAFNPDATLTAQMETLAKKRDRSATPPEEVHYDASKEVRTKGVGFFQFSRDKEGREREMEGLEKERGETERGRREGEERREERRRRVEERRKLVVKKKGERLAERFLDGLDVG